MKLKLVLVFGGSIAVLVAGSLLSLFTEARASGEHNNTYSASVPADPEAVSQLP